MTEGRTLSSLLGKLADVAARPTDPASLAAFRILFGATMTVALVRFMANGWVDDFFVDPSFHFTYWGFEWIHPWPAWGMHAHFAALTVLAALVTIGLYYRAAIALFFVGFTYVELMDVTYYLNHYYLVSLLALLLCFVPANAIWSVDARRRGSTSQITVPALSVWVLRLQVGVVYFYAGLAKFGTDWLLGAQPLNIWLSSRTDFPILGAIFREPVTAYAMSWAGFLFDTSIVLWLSWRRTRVAAYLAVVAFHTMTGSLFRIGMFPFIMTTSALIFFDPSWPRRLLTLIGRARPRAAPVLRAPAPHVSRWTLGAAAAYAVFQIVFPLRCHLYGGDVLWHEQGMRWSWKVMIREKASSVTFVVRSEESRVEHHVHPKRYLNLVQQREMGGQPDLILQLAHRIRDDYRKAGHKDVRVFADVLTSLNGRRSARLVDPEVDLATIHDGIAPAKWILPAPEAAPPLLAPPRAERTFVASSLP